MKWLKSTNNKEYTACGKVIPAINKAPLAVSEAVYNDIMAMAVIKSLVKTGGIIILDKYTADNVSGDAAVQKLQALSTENARLSDRIRELESKSEAPSKKEIKDAEKRAVAAEKELEAMKAKYAALEAEANAKIAELSQPSEESVAEE